MAPRAVPALELRFPARPDAADLADRVLAVLGEFDLHGIDEGTAAPDAIDDRPRRWQVGFVEVSARDRAAEAIAAAVGDQGVEVLCLDLDEVDWVGALRAGWSPLEVGRLLVVPPWHDAAGTDRVVIVIRPSRGFGTGHHASTRLSLEALQALPLVRRRVIDVGTGSGILAIAAAKLGAREVVAFDHDPDAVVSAADNIARNQVGDRVTLLVTDLSRVGRLGLAPADVVTANLTAALLVREAPTLWSLVAPGGALVASGLLVDQVTEVETAFARAGGETVTHLAVREAEGWAALVAERGRASTSVSPTA